MMVSPQNDHRKPSFPLSVKQDSLNKIHGRGEEEEEEDEGRLFMENPSSSSSSTPIVLGNVQLKQPSSIEHVWDEFLHQNATNSDMCFQEQGLEPDMHDHHSMEISPQPLMSIDPMAMTDSPGFEVLPEIGNYLDNQQLLGFPALPLQVDKEGCKSTTKETVEKSVERRQRRMIKNRESAARSRARKQAHTTRLEKQVYELRSRNNWLKKLKEAEMVLNSDQRAAAQPRYQLRRTTSSPF